MSEEKKKAIEMAIEVDEYPLEELGADEDIHVVPVGDLREHVAESGAGTSCWCKPTRNEECERVVVHNSLDGREKYEDGRKKH